jgi:hypothetical protein
MIAEKELQKKIVELLKDESFLDAISNQQTIYEALNVNSDENHIPHLSIDDLLKKKYSKACSLVLDSIAGCKIITGEIIKNISLTADEKLFPDVILFNDETAQIILIENKVSSKTGREAITEVFGYMNEIRNHLPFTSHYDVSIIIISPVFDTLLDHSISSNILTSNINLLCLVPQYNQDKLTFTIHFPKSWTHIGQNNLPENGLVSYSWGLKKKDLDLSFNEMSILNLARELIVSNASRYGSSGLVLIWENGLLEHSQSEYVITNYVINPFAFLPNADKSGFEYKNTILSSHLKNYSDESGGLIHPTSLFKIMDEAEIFLKEYFEIEIDSASDWTYDLYNEIYRLQRKPLFFDSWGIIGDYVRFFYFHPAVRKHYFDNYYDNYLGHLNPIIGLQIINMITKNTIFNNGHFHGYDLFKFGKQLAYFNHVCNLIKHDYNPVKSSALLFWSCLEISQSLKEIEFYAINSLGLDREIDLKIHLPVNMKDVKDNFKESNDLFAKNFNKLFLSGDENLTSRKIFHFGYNFGLYYTDLWKPALPAQDVIRIEKEIGTFLRNYLTFITVSVKNKERKLNHKELYFLDTNVFNNGFTAYSIEKISEILKDIPDEFYALIFTEFLEAFQVTIGIPQRELAEFIVPKSIDWKWMKESLARQFKQGHKHGCVNVEPNGTISISQVEEEYKILQKLENEEEIYLKTYSYTTLYIYRKVLWKDIESGKAFNPRK